MISRKITASIQSGSMIRKMFEEGNRLKGIYGEENVFDFSIGNPDLEPPEEVVRSLCDLTASPAPGMHGYMSNNGYLSTRTAVARSISTASVTVPPDAICMTVGAAGAMNAVLKSILDPGDEVILLSPFFMEYTNYIENHCGVAVIVPTDPDTFMPNPDRIDAAIGPKTKAIIINSPNNPSGALYPKEILSALNDRLLARDQVIHVISDEPYRELVYDGRSAPSTMSVIKNLIICYSWSKSLSLPGERIGYSAVSPEHEDFELLAQAIVLSNRILGSVNAPALFQKVIEFSIHAKVDIANYEKRRNMLFDILIGAGFTVAKPAGAFYLFARSPEDDIKFCRRCAEERVLVVPGSAFSSPGYFRLAFCASEKTILGSEEAFRVIGRSYGLCD
jgi:aspartate aminotransferase